MQSIYKFLEVDEKEFWQLVGYGFGVGIIICALIG